MTACICKACARRKKAGLEGQCPVCAAERTRAAGKPSKGAETAGRALIAGAAHGLVWPDPADVERLVQAGFAPVLRWVDVANRDDKPWKAVEVLTMLDRRNAKEKE